MLKFISVIFKREGTNPDNEAFFDALNNQLTVSREDADLVKKELNLLEAEGQWLDEWGDKFGLSRRTGESDEVFRDRILSLMENKVTIPAIKRAIKKVLGDDTIIGVYEPYVDVAFYNVSAFSGTGRYPDAVYYRTGVIDITINKPPTEMLARFVNRIKPASIIVRFTYKPTPPLDSIIIDGTAEQEVLAQSNTKTLKVIDTDGEVNLIPKYSVDGKYSGETVIWTNNERENI